MSFLVAVYVNEGIVLASDRRSTYTRTESINGFTVQKIGIHVTNSTDKTFLCPNGQAFQPVVTHPCRENP